MKKITRWVMCCALLCAFLGASAPPLLAAGALWWPQYDRTSARQAGTEALGAITALQYLLRARGHKVAVDGVYGAQTENALKAFQRKNGVLASGKTNNATWEALIIRVKYGSQGDAVRAAQRLLRKADYDIPINGKFGPATRDATLKYQRISGLKSDGVVGRSTWNRLLGGGGEEGD